MWAGSSQLVSLTRPIGREVLPRSQHSGQPVLGRGDASLHEGRRVIVRRP
jgi:hypothetical protein